VRAALCAVVGLALGCNAILGITDTTYRADAGAPGHAGSAATLSSSETASPCTTNGECLDRSGEFDPSVCVAGQCVALLTPECPLALPQTERLWLENLRHSEPDPVIFGAFAAVPPSLVGMDARNYDLVITEVTHAVGGLPTADGKRRPVLAVVCRNQDYATPDGLDRAIDHLTNDLQVPGILAGLEAHDLEYAFERQGLAHHVFFLSPYDADRALVDLVDDGLVWEMLSGGEQLAPTYGPLLDRALAALRSSGRLGKDESARVALVTTEDVSALAAISDALTTGGVLQFNGHSAPDNSPNYFRAVSVASSALASQTPDYTDAIQLLLGFAPHVVIAEATDEFLTTIMPAVEAEVPDLSPFYLLSPWHCQKDRMDALLTRLPAVQSRLAGVNYAGAADSTLYDEYQARFDAAFPTYAGTRGYENFYDAGYYLIYAAVGAGTVTPLMGSDLVNGMRRLLSGRLTFGVGPDDLLPAFMELQTSGTSIVLNGAMGPPNFDPRTGARDEPGSVWCVDADHTLQTDVLRLDAAGDLTGNFPCFDFPAP
jgi:hypothetical protein